MTWRNVGPEIGILRRQSSVVPWRRGPQRDASEICDGRESIDLLEFQIATVAGDCTGRDCRLPDVVEMDPVSFEMTSKCGHSKPLAALCSLGNYHRGVDISVRLDTLAFSGLIVVDMDQG